MIIMDNTKQIFIKTSDEETKNKLESAEFELIDFTNGMWTFLNNPKKAMCFDKDGTLEKVVFSNKLFI